MKATISKKWTFQVGGKVKTVAVVNGDMLEGQKECDVVVCSAFRGDYCPLEGTLIHALYESKGINVGELSRNPSLDFKNAGVWLSQDTGTSYRRVACVELIDLRSWISEYEQAETILKKGFSTLRFLIEQADLNGIPVQTIAMPLLGGGSQQIEIEYILGPMIAQCKRLIDDEENVENIVIYERNEEKTRKIIAAFDASFQRAERDADVFISYCTKQAALAQEIFKFLTDNDVSCWMAPLSIPAGSSYLEEIPVAINKAKVLLVIVTPDAEASRWVKKEVGSAIGANKAILPYMPDEYAVSTSFLFLLEGEQILPGYLLCKDNFDLLYERVRCLNA